MIGSAANKVTLREQVLWLIEVTLEKTVTSLARKIGVPSYTLYRILDGKPVRGDGPAKRISRAFDETFGAVFTEAVERFFLEIAADALRTRSGCVNFVKLWGDLLDGSLCDRDDAAGWKYIRAVMLYVCAQKEVPRPKPRGTYVDYLKEVDSLCLEGIDDVRRTAISKEKFYSNPEGLIARFTTLRLSSIQLRHRKEKSEVVKLSAIAPISDIRKLADFHVARMRELDQKHPLQWSSAHLACVLASTLGDDDWSPMICQESWAHLVEHDPKFADIDYEGWSFGGILKPSEDPDLEYFRDLVKRGVLLPPKPKKGGKK